MTVSCNLFSATEFVARLVALLCLIFSQPPISLTQTPSRSTELSLKPRVRSEQDKAGPPVNAVDHYEQYVRTSEDFRAGLRRSTARIHRSARAGCATKISARSKRRGVSRNSTPARSWTSRVLVIHSGRTSSVVSSSFPTRSIWLRLTASSATAKFPRADS